MDSPSLPRPARLARTSGVTLAVARDGQRLFVGSEVPDALVPVLADAVGRSPAPTDLDREPAAIGACRAILEPVCGLAARMGLRRIGSTWHLLDADLKRSKRHPLSRPRP